MPRGDGSGPMGQGPMTGRGFGYCAGYPAPGYAYPGGGRGGRGGRGRGGGGRGRGWGWGAPYSAPPVPYAAGPGWPAYGVPPVPPQAPVGAREQELEALKHQAEVLENTLGQLKQRIDDLEAGDDEA